jgi:hypothetical protein
MLVSHLCLQLLHKQGRALLVAEAICCCCSCCCMLSLGVVLVADCRRVIPAGIKQARGICQVLVLRCGHLAAQS